MAKYTSMSGSGVATVALVVGSAFSAAPSFGRDGKQLEMLGESVQEHWNNRTERVIQAADEIPLGFAAPKRRYTIPVSVKYLGRGMPAPWLRDNGN